LTPSYVPTSAYAYNWPQLVSRDSLTVTDGLGTYTLRPKYGPGCSVYRMVPPGYYPAHITGPDMANQMFENFFIIVRVLPYDDYSGLDDDDVTFERVYDEVLRYYVLIFPAMSKRLPLDDPSVWRSPAAASYVLKMTDVSLWEYYHYMPRTRDLSRYRRELLQRFCRKVAREARLELVTTEENAHAAH
jgi:hypothetical protein